MYGLQKTTSHFHFFPFSRALHGGAQPKERAFDVLGHRKDWGNIEFRASTKAYHNNNGDRSSAASFHKTLPHDDLGQVCPPPPSICISSPATKNIMTLILHSLYPYHTWGVCR